MTTKKRDARRLGAATKRAQKIRNADEFSIADLVKAFQPPPVAVGAFAWNLVDIVNARNAQMTGRFKMPARLAESMRTDDALAVAYGNRLAPLRAINVEMQPAKPTGEAKAIATEAEGLFGQRGIGASPETIRDLHGCLVNHGVAFAQAIPVVRADGTRIDYFAKAWPIEFVRWDPHDKVFKTQVDGGSEETITHGDGRWIILQEGEIEPFKNGSLLSAAMVWARHAFAVRDWSKGSVAHGSAKAIGKMPQGIPTKKSGAGGTTVPSDEAAAMMELLRAIVSSDSPVGLLPFGADVNFLTNTSTAWEVWNQLVLNAERSAARVYLGTDGMLGAQGGAPGVDISALFGVATTKILADVACIERALQTGLIEIWTAVNFGDSTLAPYRKYLVPDADADALKKSLGDRTASFSAALKGLKDSGIAITQEHVDGLAADFNVRAPKLPIAPTTTRRRKSAA